MKAIGKIKIEEGLTLNNPQLSIKMAMYNWINNTLDVECIFIEENSSFKHSRTFEFELDHNKEYTTNDVMQLIKTVEALKSFE
jgi:hypothetical protein